MLVQALKRSGKNGQVNLGEIYFSMLKALLNTDKSDLAELQTKLRN